MNATHQIIEQFMSIYRTPGINSLRKVGLSSTPPDIL